MWGSTARDGAQTTGCPDYTRKSAVIRRHFASLLVSELTTMCDGAAPRNVNRFSDAVEMWLEPPSATNDEQAALAALCTHASSFAADAERRTKSGSEVLTMPTEFLSQPFAVPQVGPLCKCQLCRESMSRVFVNPVTFARASGVSGCVRVYTHMQVYLHAHTYTHIHTHT